MNTNTLTHFQYRLAPPNNGNATVHVEQKVNGVYQYLTTPQTQTTSGLYEIFLPMTACYAYRKSSLPIVSSPNQENIRISVNGTSGFALQQISLDRDNVDTLVIRYLVSRGYRYGFNGMEKDDEIKGKADSYDFGARFYDSRLGRWLSIDPLAGKYPDLSPYNFVANSPIIMVDFDGRDFEPTIDHQSKSISLKARIYTTTADEDILNSSIKHWQQSSGKYDVKFGRGKNAVRYNVKFEFIIKETDRELNIAYLKDDSGMANRFKVDDLVVAGSGYGDDHGATFDSKDMYISKGLQEKRKTGSHEVGHIFGLGHRNKNLMRVGKY